jgi:hypothetical protein
MCPHRGDLLVEHVGDVRIVVRSRAVDQPDFRHPPGFQALFFYQIHVREPVACTRVDRPQRDLTGCPVVGVTATESRPVPLRTPGHRPLRAGLTDDAHQIAAQARTVPYPVLVQAEKPGIRYAEHFRGSPLLGAADARDGRAGHRLAEATRVPVGQHAVGDLGAGSNPSGDRAAQPELDVIGMRSNHEGSLKLVVRPDHHALLSRKREVACL